MKNDDDDDDVGLCLSNGGGGNKAGFQQRGKHRTCAIYYLFTLFGDQFSFYIYLNIYYRNSIW